MNDDLALLGGLASAPIITALVAAIGSGLPAVPRRVYPLLAAAIGIGWNVAIGAAANSLDWRTPLLGVVAGLAASGLYSGAVRPLSRGQSAAR
jgi:high-affinity Fe2+/Pb2+ permease